ncbi:MAG: hypothetical protein QXL74_06025 [Candidatus Bathyarchaeia archaeon]
MSIMFSERRFIEVFRETSRKIICSSLGESAGEAVLFFLREALKCDPFEVLWEDPRAVYYEMMRVLGEGAKVLINLLVTNINRERGLNMSPDHFLELMRNGDQRSVEELRLFLRKMAEVHGEA